MPQVGGTELIDNFLLFNSLCKGKNGKKVLYNLANIYVVHLVGA